MNADDALAASLDRRRRLDEALEVAKQAIEETYPGRSCVVMIIVSVDDKNAVAVDTHRHGFGDMPPVLIAGLTTLAEVAKDSGEFAKSDGSR